MFLFNSHVTFLDIVFFFCFFFYIFEEQASIRFVLNVIWELSEWESGSEFPSNHSHSSHTDRKWTATLGKFNSVVVHCGKRLNHVDI